MKFSKICAVLLAVGFAMGAFADAKNALIAYYTTGPDTYMDKERVLDGEWYALVWSADGVFEGITTEGKPAGAGDEIVMMAPLAKDYHCPYSVFQIDSAAVHTTGKYAVYLLDTRNAAKTAVAAAGADGKPAVINGAIAAMQYAATADEGVSAGAAAGGAWAASSVDESSEGYRNVRVADINVVGANVEIIVEGMMPGIKYNVLMGDDVNDLSSYALEVPQTKENPKFTISKDAAQFFKVVREPLAK